MRNASLNDIITVWTSKNALSATRNYTLIPERGPLMESTISLQDVWVSYQYYKICCCKMNFSADFVFLVNRNALKII